MIANIESSFRNVFNIYILSLVAMFIVSSQCLAESTLVIKIEGFESDDGLARIVLFDSQASYEGKAPPYKIESVSINQRKAIWAADGLPAGAYAAIVHHDKEPNDELDRPYFSLPLEPYGFSNNVFRTFGVPLYEDVTFTVDSTPTAQQIAIQYNPTAAVALSIVAFGNLIVLALVLVAPLLISMLLRRWFGPWTSDARLLGRIGLSFLLLATSSAHFTNTELMTLMLPEWIPARGLLIYATGILEIVLAVALWIKDITPKVGLTIALMLVAFLPANIYAAMNSIPFGGNEIGPPYLLVRVPFQVFLVWWTIWSTQTSKTFSK